MLSSFHKTDDMLQCIINLSQCVDNDVDEPQTTIEEWHDVATWSFCTRIGICFYDTIPAHKVSRVVLQKVNEMIRLD